MKKDNQLGFTMVELLIGIAIIAFLILGVTNFAKVSFSSFKSTSNALEANRQVRLALDRVFEDLRVAKSATPSADNHSLTYQCWDDTSDRTLYKGADNRIYIQQGSNIKPITRSAVNSLTCTRNATDTTGKSIDITIQFSDSTALTTTVRIFNQ